LSTQSKAASETPAIQQPYPSETYAWWVLGVLFLALLVSYVDRQIPALLVGPMKRDLGMNDTQAGWMYSGFAFFYAIAGLPIARMADRKSRRMIITIGILSWSFMTLMCGLAKNFWTLFAARIGVGVGEATLGPTTHSLVGDYFPRARIPRALSVFQVGAVVGSGLAFYIIGAVLEFITNHPPGPVPYFGMLREWQWVFIYVGAPGLLVVLLMATVKEPIRRVVSKSVSAQQGATFAEVKAFYRQNWKTFLTHHVGFSFFGMVGYAFVFWTPTFFNRVYGMDPGEAAKVFGMIFMVFGALGVLGAAFVGEWIAKKGWKDAYIVAGLAGGALTLPFVFLIQLMPDPTWAFILYAPAMFFVNSPFGLANGAIPVITPANMRAQVAAVYSVIVSVFGMGLGPVIGGALNDYAFPGDDGVRMTLMTMAVLCGGVGITMLWICRKYYAQSMERADEWDMPPNAVVSRM
jgi:MFS family permease